MENSVPLGQGESQGWGIKKLREACQWLSGVWQASDHRR